MENKILFVVRGLNIGGIEKYILRFLHVYHDKIVVEIFCKSGNSGYLLQSFKDLNIKVHSQYFGDISFLSWINFYKFLDGGFIK